MTSMLHLSKLIKMHSAWKKVSLHRGRVSYNILTLTHVHICKAQVDGVRGTVPCYCDNPWLI